jgi:Flp pilus assembly protein TadG
VRLPVRCRTIVARAKEVPISRLRVRSATDESGAVAVLVAICLVAVMAMVAMTVDVGSLLFHQRALVNSSDAAALAAAQSCYGTDDADVPEDVADQYAMQNTGGLEVGDGGIVPSRTRWCDTGRAGHVTVRYGQDESLFFAPVMGQGRTAHVGTEATASWGATGVAPPIPLVINVGAFQGPCEIPDVPIGATCYIWEDNDLLDGSNFGFLDVDNYPAGGWDIPVDGSCNSSGGDGQLVAWISGTDLVEKLRLNYPYATYVCAHGGNHSQPLYNALRDLIGLTSDFPINGISPADNGTQVVLPSGQPDKYNIIGFAQLEIIDVLTIQQTAPLSCIVTTGFTNPMDLMSQCGIPSNATFLPASVSVNPGPVTWSVTPAGIFSWTGTREPNRIVFDYTVPSTDCGGAAAPNGSGHCLIVKWNGSTVGGENPGGGEDFGFGAVRLCDLDYGTCPDQT